MNPAARKSFPELQGSIRVLKSTLKSISIEIGYLPENDFQEPPCRHPIREDRLHAVIADFFPGCATIFENRNEKP